MRLISWTLQSGSEHYLLTGTVLQLNGQLLHVCTGTAMPAIEITLPSTGTVLSAKSTAVTSKGTV
jgi:hypothetical protein